MNWDSLKEGFELIGMGMLGTVAFGLTITFIRDRFFPLKPPQPTKAFRSGDKQAVFIPAEIAYDQPDIKLEIERIGDELRIRPRQPAPQKT